MEELVASQVRNGQCRNFAPMAPPSERDEKVKDAEIKWRLIYHARIRASAELT